MRRKCPTRRSKPRFFPGVPAARRGPADGREVGGWSERSPAKWPGPHTVDFVAVTLNRHTRTERTDHRGERGANLTNTARGTPLDLADLRHDQDFDKPRCCEASRPVGPSGPQASRAPSDFFRGERKECGCRSAPASSQTTAVPAPVKNTGGGALATSNLILRSPPKAGVSKDGHMTAPWFETRSFGALLTMRPSRLVERACTTLRSFPSPPEFIIGPRFARTRWPGQAPAGIQRWVPACAGTRGELAISRHTRLRRMGPEPR